MNKYCFIIIILLGACNGDDNSESLVHNVGFAQGTSYNIKYMSINGEDFHHEIDSIFLELDSSLSTYVSYSLISRLNSGDTNIVLDDHFVRVFKSAQEVSQISNGLFDCTLAPLVDAWGFGKNIRKEMDSLTVYSLLQEVGYESVTLEGDTAINNPLNRTFDFNALAQGYTVDVIAEFLDKQAIQNYLIEVGGELKAKGLNSRDKIWTVGIDKPSNDIDKNDRFQTILNLKDKSLATSGNYRKFYEKNGQRYSHTINPSTGYPVQHALLSATVIADDCMKADAYATTFMVMGVEPTKEFLKLHPELDAFLIFTNADNLWENWSTEGFKVLEIN